MSRQPDVELVLRAYLADTGDAAPDRVLTDVADRIARQPRRAWRLRGRPFVNTYAKLALAAAAILAVAVAGYSVLPRQLGPGGQISSPPSASPTAAPTAAPTAIPLKDGPLPVGSYRIPLDFAEPGLSVVADVPAGWQGHPDVVALTTLAGSNDGILLTFMEADGLFSDACHWNVDGTGAMDQPGDVPVGPTVADMVAALKANASYPSSTPKPVTLGGYEGQELELQLPSFDVIAKCDRRAGQTEGDYFVFPGGFYAQSGNSRWHLYIVDVDGTRLITLVSLSENVPPADVAAAEAIVKSFRFTP